MPFTKITLSALGLNTDIFAEVVKLNQQDIFPRQLISMQNRKFKRSNTVGTQVTQVTTNQEPKKMCLFNVATGVEDLNSHDVQLVQKDQDIAGGRKRGTVEAAQIPPPIAEIPKKKKKNKRKKKNRNRKNRQGEQTEIIIPIRDDSLFLKALRLFLLIGFTVSFQHVLLMYGESLLFQMILICLPSALDLVPKVGPYLSLLALVGLTFYEIRKKRRNEANAKNIKTIVDMYVTEKNAKELVAQIANEATQRVRQERQAAGPRSTTSRLADWKKKIKKWIFPSLLNEEEEKAFLACQSLYLFLKNSKPGEFQERIRGKAQFKKECVRIIANRDWD